MRIAILLAATALSFHPKLPQFQPPGEVAIELGCPLSGAGFEKLKRALPWKDGKERADYYFDGYDGERYLMKKQQVKLKVRVKVSGKGARWQVSRFLAKDDVEVDGLVVKVHTTESWEGKLKGKDGKALLAATDLFFEREAAGGAPFRAAGDQVDRVWRKLRAGKDLPGLPAFDHYMGGRSYRFYPVKRTRPKQRLKASLDGLQLMLGTEPERDAAGRPLIAHELEVEPSTPWTLPQARLAALQIGRLLRQAGVTAADQVEAAADGHLFTLRQLKK